MSNTFLWKPHSESNGNLVVLTPQSLNGQITSAGVRTPDGRFIEGRYAGQHNGDRGHWRFGASGDAYPVGSTFEIRLNNGQVIQQRIGNTGDRFETSSLARPTGGGDSERGGPAAPRYDFGGGSVNGGSAGPGPFTPGQSPRDYVFTSGIFQGWTYGQAQDFLIQQEVDKREAYENAGLIDKPEKAPGYETQLAGMLGIAATPALVAGAWDWFTPDKVSAVEQLAETKAAAELAQIQGTAANAGTQAATGAAQHAGTQAASGLPPAVPNVLPGSSGTYSGIGPVASGADYGSSLAAANAPTHTGWLGGLSAAPGTSALGSTTLGAFLPAAGIAAGAYTGMESIKGIKNAIDGKDLSLTEQAALALPTFGASFLYNPVKDFFGSGKDKDQRGRDESRNWFRENTGIYGGETGSEGESLINIANGTWDTRSHPDDASYNIDWTAPDHDAIGQLDALTLALMGGGARNQGGRDRVAEMTGEFYNAATRGGGDVGANLGTIWQNSGLGWGDAKERIRQQWAAGQIDAGQRDASFAAIDKQFGVANPTGARWEDQAGLSEEERRRNDQELKRKKK